MWWGTVHVLLSLAVMTDPCNAKLILGTILICLHFLTFLNFKMAQAVEIRPRKNKDPFILRSQQYDFWYLDDTMSQHIGIHDIDLVVPD